MNKGFTLVELLVAMAVSTALISGVGMAYISLSQSVDVAKNIENSLEVLRYSNELFNRSLKQTTAAPAAATPQQLSVVQSRAGTRACDGTTPAAVPFTEAYRFEQPNLFCDAGNGEVLILKSIENMTFVVNGDLVQITVLPQEFPVEDLPNGVRMDYALTGKILMEATQ